ncbi:SC6A9-like protein [Mya arenaria]|uniref:SC6A9-like protein n=1 Tax=Mya arenaria TaxID=6604 RepID=A0ABY7F0M3_MYAAR|nr:SC6A9-like protein [Mya arenaria]
MVDSRERARLQWRGKLEFLFTSIGFTVGLGNIWRFPHRCYVNGGGAFLLPYAITLLLCAFPMLFLEMFLGQFASEGAISIWKICPLLNGVGWAIIFNSTLTNIYYSVIVMYSVYYTFVAFVNIGGPLPWQSVNNSAISDHCLNSATPEDYWNKIVLRVHDDIDTEKKDFDNLGAIVGRNSLCLLFVWLFVLYCCLRGIRSIARVTYATATFPVLFLLIMFVRGVTLDGYKEGLNYFFKPDWSKLSDMAIWSSAASQAMYSMGTGYGAHIVLASYNEFHNNTFRDGIILCIINTATSIFGGIIVFSFLGYASVKNNQPMSEIADNGPGMIFISYIQGISELPGSAFWAFLFFVMVFTLGVDSLFVLVWTIYASLEDIFPEKFFRWKKFILCSICLVHYLLCLPLVTEGGIHIVVLMDQYTSNLSLALFLLLEAITVCWIYGLKKFVADMELMVGKRFIWMQWYLRVTWLTTVPAFCLIREATVEGSRWEPRTPEDRVGTRYDDNIYIRPVTSNA